MNLKGILIIAASIISLSASAKQWTAPMTVPSAPSTTHDVLALNPWELLGEDDGLGEAADEPANFFSINREDLVNYARKFLGCRYARGGKSPKGFDCSGFTSYVFSNFGLKLNPSSRAQGLQGQPIAMNQLKEGDLLFFAGRRGGKTVGHVGMVVDVKSSGRVKFIHASSSQGVVIQNYPDGGYYQKRFLHARRIVS